MNGLGFLAPALLAALAALAVPVVLHLLKRERHRIVEFPSLMFLRRIPVESTSRRRLRHPWLLLLRCLALALLAFAFARPFLRGRDTVLPATDGAREVVVLLDRSASMTYGDRWPRAVAAVRAAIDGLDGDDRLSLVAFDRTATALTEPTDDRDALRTALDQLRPGAGGTRFGPALRIAQGLLETSDRRRREVVLVTDFQRAGWDGATDVRLPPGTELTRVDLSGATGGNLAVAGVELAHASDGTRERIAVTARLLNHDDAPVAQREVALSLDGRTLQTRTVDVPAAGGATVRFDPVPLPPEPARGIVRVAGDALPADDAFHFVATRAPVRRALVVEPPGSGASPSYLRRALALAREPAWEVVARPLDRLREADVANVSLVVLDDVVPPTGDVGRRLATFVREGGGLVVVLGPRTADAAWRGPMADAAPLRLGDVRDRRGGGALATIDRTHPVFAPFRSAGGGDFAATRVLRYREIGADTALQVLARYDDGAAALAERRAGRGRVLVWTGSLDAAWSDLPLQPVFLPLVHELARHAAGEPPAAPWHVAGARVDVARYAARLEGRDGAPADAAAARWLAVAPSGERVRVGGDAPPALETREAGFYDLRPLGGTTRARPLAVNADPEEGDLTSIDPDLVAVAIDGAAPAGQAAAAPVRTAADDEERQALWWWLLAAALVLLAAEAGVANRVTMRTR